jgi:hypothetical protein
MGRKEYESNTPHTFRLTYNHNINIGSLEKYHKKTSE